MPRVLFVDDEPSIPHVLCRLLPCRVDTVVVTSGLKAIRELEAFPFDLVVSDLQMPGLSGSDLLILVAERWPDARRILLTSHTDGDLLERSRKYADAILDKVLDLRIITGKICRLAYQPRRRPKR